MPSEIKATKAKRPLNAYFLFSKERRPALQKANPDMKVGPISKLIGAEWKKMSESDKAPYTKQAKELKAAFEKAQEV